MESTRIARKYNAKGSQVGDLMDPVRDPRCAAQAWKDAQEPCERKSPPAESPPKAEPEKQGEAGKEPAKFVMKRFQNAKARVVMGSVQNGADAKAQSQALCARVAKIHVSAKYQSCKCEKEMRDTHMNI